METLITFLIAAGITLIFLRGYLKAQKEREQKAREAAEKGKVFPRDLGRSTRTSTLRNASGARPAPRCVLRATFLRWWAVRRPS